MIRLGSAGLSAIALLALCCAARSAPAPRAPEQPWRRVVKVEAGETVRVETRGRSGSATYYIASPASSVVASVKGPGRLRVLLRPEFPAASSAAEGVGVTIAISNAAGRDVVAFSAPSKLARYAGKPSAAVPGEVIVAYLDIPRGVHSVEVSARRRVGVKLYVAR